MKAQTVSVGEIADLVGVSKRAAEKRATRESWPHTLEATRGGQRRLYYIASLPADVQRAVQAWQSAAALVRHGLAAPVTPKVAVATPDVALSHPSTALRERSAPIAPMGEPIPAGKPSPADTSAAATDASGFTPGRALAAPEIDMGVARGVIAALAHPAAQTRAITANLAATQAEVQKQAHVAQQRLTAIKPLLDWPAQQRGKSDFLLAHAASLGVNKSTLLRWVAQYKAGGFAALMDKTRSDKHQARVLVSGPWEAAATAAGIAKGEQARIAAELVGVVRGLWAQQGEPSARQVALLAYPVLHRASVAAGMGEAVAKKACKLPRRFVEGERRYSMIATYDRDGKAFYDRHITPVQRQRVQLRPGEIVFGDVSPADIPVWRADGSVGWARLIAWQDAATNMLHITGYLADKGSSVRREHIALAFGAMAGESPFGLPRKLYLDNGSEYNWAHMFDVWRELGQLTGGAFGGAWVDNEALPERERAGFVHRSIPFKPRAKSIEGQFSNLQRYFGWLPGFAGGDRLRKKVATLGKGVEPITLAELKDGIGRALAYYHGVPQDGHLGGMSPAQKMEEFLNAGFSPVQVNADALALAFAERLEVKVQAGMVRAGGWNYMHEALHQVAGQVVQVRWARHMPDCAYVFAAGQALCVAMAAPVYAFADKEGAAHAGRLAKEARQAVSVMRGQVAWLDPRDLMGEFAQLAGVDKVVSLAGQKATQISTLSPEAQAIADQRHAHMMAAVDALPRQKAQLLDRRFDQTIDPEEEAARALFG